MRRFSLLGNGAGALFGHLRSTTRRRTKKANRALAEMLRTGGRSVAYQTFVGSLNSVDEPGSEYFEIFGSPGAATPEPSSFTLLGVGSAGLVTYGWRRRRRSA